MNPAPAAGNWQNRLGERFEAHSRFCALIVLAIGFVLRLREASGTFFNPDEAMHFLAANKTSLALAYRASLTTSHPPLLIPLLYYWRWLGSSELMLRMPSILAGTVFCWVFFKWLTRVLDRTTAWTGLIFAALLPSMIELSAEVRQYALLLCFLALCAYFLEAALSEVSAGKMLLSSLFLCLALLSHYSALLFAAAIGAYALLRLLQRRVPGPVVATWAAGQTAFLALFAMLYVTHLSKLGEDDPGRKVLNGWMRTYYLHSFYFDRTHDHLLGFMLARTGGLFQYLFSQLVIGDLAFLFFVAGLLLLLKKKPALVQTGPSARQIGILIVLVFAINCSASLAGFYPYGGTRHSAFLFMFALAGVSYAIARLAGPQPIRSIALVLLIVAACTAFRKPHHPYMARADQRHENMTEAIAAIHRQVSPSDRLFIDFQTRFMLEHYLCHQEPASLDATFPDLDEFHCPGYDILSKGPATWLFAADTFPRQWNEMVRDFHLKPGETVWVVQAGWDIGLAQELEKKFPEFSNLNPQSFGHNINLFKRTVAQPDTRQNAGQ